MCARRATFKTEDKMTNAALLAKTNDIHSWWEVPCIAHFCSLFRASFNLIDFDIEDLEGALLTDDVPDSENTLIRELVVRLLRGYYENNRISGNNYLIFLRRLFRQKCRDFKCFNPLDNDVDFKLLPIRTKVEVLHMLCDFRLDANDVLDILKNLDSDSLRIRPLGFDTNKSAYWYFYGTRLYREDPKKNSKKRGRKTKRDNKEIESGEEEKVDLGSGIWQVVCFTENDWKRLAVSMKKAKDSDEKMLYQIINDDFLPEIPKLFQEKARLQRRRLMMLNPRKSSRLEILKRRREEEGRTSESEADSEINAKKDKNERLKNRNMQKGVSFQSDNENSNSGSLSGSDEQGSNTSYENQTNVRRNGRGRNSEVANTELPDEKSVRMDSSSEWVDMNVLHEGMYQVLNKLKGHEDSWLFLEPVGDEQEASPVSLQFMENKLEAEKYRTLVEFEQDFHALLDKLNEQYNCWRMEYASLEKFFNDNVNQYLSGYESSDKMSFRNEQKRKRRKPLVARCSTDADKENEHLTDETSVENKIYNVEEPLNVESMINELHPIKRGKGRPPKNASTLHALDIVTEQTLRDVIKLLDDAPKCKEFCPRPSPPHLTPYNCNSVTEIPVIEESTSMCQPVKQKNSSKKRTTSARESHQKHLQLVKDRQRTIDRLQPGKSKGNLLSTTTRSQITNGEKSASKDSVTNRTENALSRPKPMLSLGSVLSSDAINLDTTSRKHTFPENNRLSSDEETYSENDDSIIEEGHQTEAENLAIEKFSSTALSSAKKSDGKPPDLSVIEMSKKPKPNLGAWFKAFGTPKPHPSPKKKAVSLDGGAMHPNLSTRDHDPLTIPSACNINTEKSFNNEDDSPNPASNVPMNQSMQSYQPPVALKVGFYQDTFAGPNFVSSHHDSIYGLHSESIASPKDHNSLPTSSLQYQSETTETFKPPFESPFSKYPMKKRISAELERRSAIEADTYRYSLTPAAPLPPATYADEAPSIPISYNSNYSESYPHLPESAIVHHQYPTYPHPQQPYECYFQQCPRYTVPHESALNFSNKNLHHPYYAERHEYQAVYETPRRPDIYYHNFSYCSTHVDYMNANQIEVKYPHCDTAVRNESLNYSNEKLSLKSEEYSPQPPKPPSNSPKKTRKRKAVVGVVEPPPAQEPGSAFNFSGASLVNCEYQQQCIEKLRNPQPPFTSSPYVHQGTPASCSYGNQPYSCPSSIYSSPYLQRPSDELLRHGLVPVTHTADYSPEYVVGHEEISRSPWL